MTWNYRIVRYVNGCGFGLHEVYYDAAGTATSMTSEPCGFACDTEEGPEGIRKSLQMALRDAAERTIFDEPAEWPESEALPKPT